MKRARYLPSLAHRLESEPSSSKKRQSLSKDTVASTWRLYFGNALVGNCLICCKKELSINHFKGKEMAHVVPSSERPANGLYDTVPACSVCNGQCGTKNMLDFCIDRGFFHSLEKILKRLLLHIFDQNQDLLRMHGGVFWRVVNYLYSSEDCHGGAIQHKKEIFTRAHRVQIALLEKRIKKLDKRRTKLNARLDAVRLESPMKTPVQAFEQFVKAFSQ